MVDIDRLISYDLQIVYRSIMFYQKPHKFLRMIGDCRPVVLNNELTELNHGESRYPDGIELMTHNNEKLKCRKVGAVLRYHQPNQQTNIE